MRCGLKNSTKKFVGSSKLQDVENKCVERCNFVTNASNVYRYRFVLMPEGLLNQFGRALPENVQRNTGQRRANSSGGLRTHQTLQIPDVLQLTFKQQQRQQALYHFASQGTEIEKARAREPFQKIAFEDEDD